MNRREFLRQAGLTVGAATAQLAAGGCSSNQPDAVVHEGVGGPTGGVMIVWELDDPVASAAPAQWAIGRLREALAARRVPVNIVHRIDDMPTSRDSVRAGRGKIQRNCRTDRQGCRCFLPGFARGCCAGAG